MAQNRNSGNLIPVQEDQYMPATDYRDTIIDYSDEEIHIRDYIDVILRRKWLVLFILFFVFITSAIFVLSKEKLYIAAGTLEANPTSQNITKFQNVIDEKLKSREFISTQISLMQSDTVTKRVIDRLGLLEKAEATEVDPTQEKPGYLRQFKSFIKSIFSVSSSNASPVESIGFSEALTEKRALNFFKNRLTVSPQNDSLLINVSFISNDRQFACDAVNTLMEEYVDWKMDQKINASQIARQYLMKQIEQAKINLEAAEEKQNQFARKAGIVSLDSKINSVYRQLEDLNTALSIAETEVINKKSNYELALQNNAISMPEILENELIKTLKSEYSALICEYDELNETFHGEYPELKRIESRLNSIRKRMQTESEILFDSVEQNYEAACGRVASLRQKLEEKKQQALELNQRATQYNIMAREVETNKIIYQSLLERTKEIESMAGVSPTNIQVVDKASLPIFPSKPNVKRTLLMAIFLGLAGGIGAAFMLDFFADTITNPEQITDRFQIPILGVIPFTKTTPENPLERIFINDPKSGVAEALRTSKVSIQLSGSDTNAKCIAITSTTQGEGKTTIASNLAQTFCGAGERVLLIDADLRRPRLHKVFPKAAAINNGSGLSSFLAGVVNKGFIAKTSVDNLFLIPAGPIPPNPVELLASRRFTLLIEKVSKKFDRIIIDAPPHQGFADVLVLSHKVGGLILISSIGETTRDGIRHFKKSMHNVQGNVLGCIVNKVNLNQRYGYRSYYKYYKAYNYDYDKEKNGGKSKTGKIV